MGEAQCVGGWQGQASPTHCPGPHWGAAQRRQQAGGLLDASAGPASLDRGLPGGLGGDAGPW